MAKPGLSFVYFRLLLNAIANTVQKAKNGKSVDGMPGIWTWDPRMEDTDESTEQWCPQSLTYTFLHISQNHHKSFFLFFKIHIYAFFFLPDLLIHFLNILKTKLKKYSTAFKQPKNPPPTTHKNFFKQILCAPSLAFL